MVDLLNSISRKWLSGAADPAPILDCQGCLKPGKCCDFQPFVPNYILGALLEREVLLPESGEHHYTPLGLVPGRAFRERHERTPKDQRGADLRCLFFDGGCRIWSHRPGECSTYFCEGQTDGHRKLSAAAFKLEVTVAQFVLKKAGFSLPEVHAFIDELNLDKEPTDHDPKQMAEVYRRAWALAGQASPSQVRDLL